MPEFSATEQVNPDFNTAFNQAALQGVDRQKAVGGLSALRGVDLQDPNSVGNAINNSIKSGNLDQASALAGLNFQQSIRNSLPGFMDKLGAALGNQQTSNAQPQAAQPNTSHMADTMNLATSTLNDLKSVPVDQRSDALTKARPALEARGVPPEAIDSAANYILDAPDQHTQDQRIDELSNYHQSHAAHLGGIGGEQEVAPAAMTHPNSTWYNNLLDHPELMAQAAALKGVGYDITPLFEQARALGMPGIQAGVDIAKAGPIAAAQKEQEANFAGPIAAAQANAKIAPELLEELGKTNIKNANELMDVYFPGSTQPQQVTRADALKMAAAGVRFGSKPEVGAQSHAQAFGSTSGSQEAELGKPGANKADVQNSLEEEKNLTSAAQGAASRLNSHQYDETGNLARQIIGLGNAVGTGPYTKDLSAIAQRLAPMLPQSHISQYANNSTLLAQDLSQAAKLQFGQSALPRIANEFNTIVKAVPTNVSPQDTIKLYGALLLAKNNFERDADTHISNYQTNPTNGRSYTAAVQDFTNKRPDLLSYALPELKKMTIGGKPAVEVRQMANGHHIGMFLPGTPNAQKFRID